jgi:inner membrane protein COX18
MLLGQTTRLLAARRRRCISHHHCSRNLVTEALYSFGRFLPTEQVLDLAIALPVPISFPIYTTTIVLVTVASRLVFTVPFAIWVRCLTSHQFR